jgi:hypothetical protein
MALEQTNVRRQRRPHHVHIPPLPHSSWRFAAPAGKDTARLTSASDFWDRLGV